jgi:hypothetical protein
VNTTKARELGYGVHKEGSRKGKVHQLFDKEGAEAAWVLGLKLQLKQTTLRSWVRWLEAATEQKQKQKEKQDRDQLKYTTGH